MHGLEALIGWLIRPRSDEDEAGATPPRTDADRMPSDPDGRAVETVIIPLAYPLSRCHIFGVCP
ncbi:hypothetical protein [Oryzibacter oryziterrae]|uniref:hypothetical protein n=1 Tax=Oryzibacter oryziterrae TaxID=2766474 RepID=UPI001F1BCCB6|nr:hypothetical protein [Oryzibacter oryziterrae]